MGRSKIFVGRLSDTDFVAYFSILFSLIAYSFGVMVYESSELKKIISNTGGTLFNLNLSRDNSEHEWNNYLENMVTNRNIFYFLLIPVLDYIAKKFFPKYYRETMLLYSAAGFLRFYTIFGICYALAVSLVFFFASKLKYKTIIWIVSVVAMYSVHEAEVLEIIGTKLNTNRLNSYHEFVIIFYFMILRLISFSMDKIDSHRRSTIDDRSYNLLNFLTYIFFPSFLSFAPFLSFRNFIPCLNTTNTENKARSKSWIAKLVARILISALLIELMLRLTLTYALVFYHRHFFSYFTLKSLIMAHLIRGALFTCKYIVYYGIPTLLNQLVGMNVTELPRCITVIHTNSELWRYFDTGLYDFIKNYLYIPLGGNKSFQLISLVLSFSFVSYWHGFGYAISVWSAINCSMIVAEIFYANYFLKIDFVKEAISGYSLRKKRILLAIILGAWQMIMYLNASLFLDDVDSTANFFTEFFLTSRVLIYLPLALLCFYCNAQLRLEFVDFFF